jgi:hypothetical protein
MVENTRYVAVISQAVSDQLDPESAQQIQIFMSMIGESMLASLESIIVAEDVDIPQNAANVSLDALACSIFAIECKRRTLSQQRKGVLTHTSTACDERGEAQFPSTSGGGILLGPNSGSTQCMDIDYVN